MSDTYRIVRFYMKHAKTVVKTGLTLAEAKAWCNDPEASSRTATSYSATQRTNAYGPWFEGFEKEED